MKKLIAGLAVAALLPLSAPVMAKDICVDTVYGKFYLKGVPAIKPKAIIGLKGILIQSGNDFPVYGTLSAGADGAIRYVITIAAPQDGWNFTVDISATDKTLAGTGKGVQFTNAGAFTSSGPFDVTSLNCKTVVRP